jgi:catechol 2,3-dioxygenase-like lactoylglutathione lyase family enzyme
MVEDFQATLTTFREKLGLPVVDASEDSIVRLGAAVAVCAPDGGSMIEVMGPGDPATPLSQSVQGFIDRRGQGHFALMLEAADPDKEAEGLATRGLAVMPPMPAATGRDIHPKSNHGTLIRVYPTNSIDKIMPDKLEEVASIGLSGIARVVIVVRDLAQAINTFGTKFAIPTSAAKSNVDQGVSRAICTPPTGGVIELVAVDDAEKTYAGLLAEFLAKKGEGMYALILKSNNFEATKAALPTRGVAATDVPGLSNVLELDRATMSGARIWVE